MAPHWLAWDISHMPKAPKNPADNRALLTLIEVGKPADLSVAQWLKAARVSSSFITDLRNGVEPSIYKIERLARAAGMRLSEFWRSVELIQFEIERRHVAGLVDEAPNASSISDRPRRRRSGAEQGDARKRA